MKINNTFIKISASIAYVAMVTVNFLANSLPINNRSTGDISNAYPNLFAPAGLTFSIWGLIYLLLAGYIIYQFAPSRKGEGSQREIFLKKINLLFLVTSIANILWIFAWHYDFIALSVLIMAVLLFSLIKIADIIRVEKISKKDKIWVSLPFSVYFGWITVASIANITVFLVSIDWNGFGVSEFIWTIVILFVGMLIGVWRIMKDKNIAYGLVLIWAYLGILLKHFSASGFDKKYPSIMVSLFICLLLFIFFVAKLIFKNNQK